MEYFCALFFIIKIIRNKFVIRERDIKHNTPNQTKKYLKGL